MVSLTLMPEADVSRLVSALKGLPRLPQRDEPGERGGRNAALQRQIGIPITEPIRKALAELAAKHGVKMLNPHSMPRSSKD